MAKSKSVAGGSGASKAKSDTALKANTKNAKVEKAKSDKMTADFEEFPSSDEEEDSQVEDEEEDEEFGGFSSTDDEQEADKEPKKVPELSKEIKEQVAKRSKKNNGSKEDSDKPRVVCVGRIPHGFYEEQMRAYFSQFGPITRLRLSRNKKTGRSKHYAFIEFDNHHAAEAVAEIMNGYLLFGHILQVRILPKEKIHDDLWIGANKTFKAIPWTRISRYHNDKPKSDDKWKKLQEKHDQNIQDKNQKLKELGIDYEYNPSASSTPKKKKKASNKRK